MPDVTSPHLVVYKSFNASAVPTESLSEHHADQQTCQNQLTNDIQCPSDSLALGARLTVVASCCKSMKEIWFKMAASINARRPKRFRNLSIIGSNPWSELLTIGVLSQGMGKRHLFSSS